MSRMVVIDQNLVAARDADHTYDRGSGDGGKWSRSHFG